MGILTNALNQLVRGTIGLGIGQLDNWFDRMAAQGQAKEAAAALDQATADQQEYLRQSLSGQGGGILPTTNPDVLKNPYTGQVYTYLQNQMIQNNPDVMAAEQAQKAQEERRGLVKSMIGEGYKQNQMGFQEGLGAFDNPAGYDLSRQERISRSAERTGALEEAKGPEWDRRQAQKTADAITKKQTPTWKQLQGGGGGAKDGGGGPVSSVTTAEIGRMEKAYLRNSEYQDVGMDGKPSLNERGQNALNKAADILAGQKKKNPLRAIKEGRDAEMKEFQAQQEKTSTPQGRLDVLRGRATTPEAQQRLQEVEQQLKEGQQSTPAATPPPTAGQQTPQQKVQETQRPSREYVQEGIKRAVGNGETPEQIRQRISQAGYEPKEFGY